MTKVIRKPTLVYPVTLKEWSPDDRHPQGYIEGNWNPAEVLDWRDLKKQSCHMVGIHPKWSRC